jgi:hypothetical protein
MMREEIKEELHGYLEAWTSTPDYLGIQNQVVASGDWYGFLSILPDHQVCLIHSLGQHSSGLGRQTAAHNRFFGLLGDKVYDQLPPLVMAPPTGLAPWLRVKDVHRPVLVDLQELQDKMIKTVLRPSLNDDVEDDDWPKVSVQNVCFVPKAWAAHFLAPISPWQALRIFQSFMASIPPVDHNSFHWNDLRARFWQKGAPTFDLEKNRGANFLHEYIKLESRSWCNALSSTSPVHCASQNSNGYCLAHPKIAPRFLFFENDIYASFAQ